MACKAENSACAREPLISGYSVSATDSLFLNPNQGLLNESWMQMTRQERLSRNK